VLSQRRNSASKQTANSTQARRKNISSVGNKQRKYEPAQNQKEGEQRKLPFLPFFGKGKHKEMRREIRAGDPGNQKKAKQPIISGDIEFRKSRENLKQKEKKGGRQCVPDVSTHTKKWKRIAESGVTQGRST